MNKVIIAAVFEALKFSYNIGRYHTYPH